MKTRFAAGLLAVFAGTNAVAATPAAQAMPGVDPLQLLFEQPTLMKSFDWPNVQRSPIVRDRAWKAIEDQPAQPGSISVPAHYGRSLAALGATWDASWYPGSDAESGTFFFSRSLPLAECAVVAQEYGRLLGNPVYSDGTTRHKIDDTTRVTWNNRGWEWTVGSTRVMTNCSGLVSDTKDGAPIMTVSFRSAAKFAAWIPSFMLRCTRTFHASTGSYTSPMEDAVYGIVPGQPKSIVKSDTNDVISSSATVDEALIAFTFSSKGGPVKYVISRITGSLKAEGTDEQGKPFATITGSCEKVSSAAKF